MRNKMRDLDVNNTLKSQKSQNYFYPSSSLNVFDDAFCHLLLNC